MNFTDLTKGKEILYESSVLVNPPFFLNSRKQASKRLVVIDKTILIDTDPTTVIPFSEIKKISFSYLFLDIKARVELLNGKVYKLLWYSNKRSVFRFSLIETQVLAMDLNKIMEGKAVSVSNAGAEKKSRGWFEFILYMLLIISGWRLAGIGGLLGGMVILFGVNKTVRNIDFSAFKKVIYSALYVIWGVILAVAIAIGLTFLLRGFISQNKTENAYTVSIPEGFSEYKNELLEVQSLLYPSQWKISLDKENYMVSFEAPDASRTISFGLVAVKEGEVFDPKTLANGVIDSFKNAGMTINDVKTGTKEVNNQNALYTDITLHDKIASALYERVIVFPNGRYNGRQYIYFTMNTDENRRVSDMQTLDTMVKSLTFTLPPLQ